MESAIKDRERAFWILQDTLVNGIITIFIDLPALCCSNDDRSNASIPVT